MYFCPKKMHREILCIVMNKQIDIFQNLLQNQYFLMCRDYPSKRNEFRRVYDHLILSHATACEIFPNLEYALQISVLFHDIGKLVISDKESVKDHALKGYEWMVKREICNPEIIFGIKYHEVDEDWLGLLNREPRFLVLNESDKQMTVKSCKVVKDVDIVSNMIRLLKSPCIKVSTFSDEIVDCFFTQKLGDARYVDNEFDRIVYILCGLNIINFSDSFEFLKSNSIVSGLTNLLSYLCDEVDNGSKLVADIKRNILHRYNI